MTVRKRREQGPPLLTMVLIFCGGLVYSPLPSLAQSNLLNRLVEASKAEMAVKAGKLHVATEWTKTTEGIPILKAFQKDFPFIKELDFTRERGVDNMQRILIEVQAGRVPKYDILKVSSELWPEYARAGLFVKPPFDYHKLAKSLPPGWGEIDPRAIDPEGMFIATTARAMGNVWNIQLAPKGKEPTSWEACLDPMWKGKFLYDPRPKMNGLWYDAKTREKHLKWLRGIVGNGVVLSRGQTENVEKVVSGEFPLVCGVQYESAARIIDQGAPLRFAFPDPFPMHFSTQFHVVRWSKTPATTQLFALWAASTGQEAIDKHAYLGFPWDPRTRKYLLAKGKYVAICDAQCILRSDEYDGLHASILKLPGARSK